MIRKSLILDILHKKTVSKRCHQGEEYENISFLSPPVKSITNISVNIESRSISNPLYPAIKMG